MRRDGETSIAPIASFPQTPQLEIGAIEVRSEEHTSELQSHHDLVCRLLLEKKKNEKQKKLTADETNTQHQAANGVNAAQQHTIEALPGVKHCLTYHRALYDGQHWRHAHERA